MPKTPPPPSRRFGKFTGKCRACGAKVENAGRCKCGVYFLADGTPVLGGRTPKNAEKQSQTLARKEQSNDEQQPEKPRNAAAPASPKAPESKPKLPWYERPLFGWDGED